MDLPRWISGAFSAPLRSIIDAGLDTIHERVRIFSTELQEERSRLFHTVIFAAAIAAFGTIALVLATLAILFAFWEQARQAALTGVSAAYGGATILLYINLRKRIKNQVPLSRTLGELRNDRKCLERI